MVFTFDIHTTQDNKETKFHHVIKFDQWNASLVLRHDKQARALWLVYYTVVFKR